MAILPLEKETEVALFICYYARAYIPLRLDNWLSAVILKPLTDEVCCYSGTLKGCVIHQTASEQTVLKIDVMEAGKIGKSIRIWVTLTCVLGQSISRTVGRVVCSRYAVGDTYQKWFKDRQLARGSGNQRNKSDLMLVMLVEADLSAAKKSSPSCYSFVYQKVTRFLK